MNVLMSPECKAYERFARSNYPDDPFPMPKNKLIRYIKFRARCSTFFSFMSNLDKHPLHGEPWLNKMNNDPDVRHLMKLSINLWPREAKECKGRLIGVDYVNPTIVPVRDNISHVPQTPKKRGYMVTETEPTTNYLNQGHTPDSPIDLNDYHHVPTMPFESLYRSSHTSDNLATLVAKFRPDPKPYVMKKRAKKPIEPPKKIVDKPKRTYKKKPVYVDNSLDTKIKEPIIRIERPAHYTMKDVVVVISRPEPSLATIPTFILQRYMKGEVSESFLKEYLKGFIEEEEEEDPKQTTLDQYFK